MDIQEEKKNLLLEMIAFATVEGQLQKKDFDFLFILSNTLNIERGGFMDLFQQKTVAIPIKTKSLRVQQFYKLALFMQRDGTLLLKDAAVIRRFAITMVLKLEVCKRFIKKMKSNPNTILSKDTLFRILEEEGN